MSALKDHFDSEQLGRRYKQYEAAYNAQFASDPDPDNRKFQEYDMPKVQQERLELFRGNDHQAMHAHRSNPHDPLAKPTATEEKMWAANEKQHWAIDREPDQYLDHPASKNKWLPVMSREKANQIAEYTEQKHGTQYDAYAEKAGSGAQPKEDWLRTQAVVELESARSAQQRQQAPQQAAPGQPPAQQSEQPAAQEAPQARSRLSVANFQGTPEQYIDSRVKAMEGKDDASLRDIQVRAESEHRALGRGPIAEEAPKVQAWNDYKAKEAEQLAARQQDVAQDVRTRQRQQ